MSTELVIEDKGVKKLIRQLIDRDRKISDRDQAYVGLLSAIVFQDIIKHFEDEQGPTAKWPEWGPKYRAIMERKGKGGNKLLQDTGRLKGGWVPANVRTVKDGIVWFNPVRYANRHDEGIGVKKRKFTWLSNFAMQKIERQTLQFILDE